MKRQLTTLICLLFAFVSGAQDNLGIAGSSRAPANTVLINPSSIVDSRAFIDINLVGFGVFARNTLAYIPGGKVSMDRYSQLEAPSYNRDNAPYSAYADVMVHGPSATFAVRQHAFGIYTGFRTVADVRGIPKTLGYYLTEGFQYRPQMGVEHTVKDMRANALSWMEAGISYGTIISRSGDMITQGGITVKRLFGVAGVGMRVDDWTYTVLDSSSLETARFRGEYAFNDPGIENPSIINGSGWGVDIGITFKQRLKPSESYSPYDPCTDGDYRYKFAFSILDIGAVRFTGPFYRNVFDENEEAQWNDFSNTTADDVSDIDSLFTQGFGVAQETSDQSRFRMMLPTGLSAQFDYNFGHNFYVMGILTGGLPWKSRLGVQRASYLGVIPRWEIKRLEVAVPVSMYEFRQPQVGIMLRLNSIVIGSDNLGWLLFRQNVYGADIYFNLKYTIFRHWKCSPPRLKDKPKVKRRNRFSPVPCPSW